VTAALLVAVLAAAAGPARVERPVHVPKAGFVVVTLDRDVYEHARMDLGDLRVSEAGGTEVPYLVQRAETDPPMAFRQPRRLNKGQLKGVGPTATLDFHEPVLKSELVLALSGDNFRRRVVVEGRNRGERQWTTLTDRAYVFAVPGPPAARYESVRLPENNYQFLRVVVEAEAGETAPVEIEDVWVRPQPGRKPAEVPLVPRWSALEDPRARETLLVLDLGARHQPVRAVVLEVADDRFLRGVAVEARRDPPAGAPPGTAVWWQPLGEGMIYRYPRADGAHESLRLEIVARERVLRLRVRNLDDRPLDVRNATAMVPVERLVFEAKPGRAYRLSYGDPGRAAPSYDLQRTVGDAAIWIAQASEGSLAEPSRITEAVPLPPWTERHPALLWAGLGAVVAALGAVTWRALRSAD
jgi:hypothetical protein